MNAGLVLNNGIILSMSGQAVLFLTSAAAGAAIGVLYDVFRIIRKAAKHPGFIIQLEDLLFWLAGTGLMFYYLLHASAGELRLYTMLGAVLGVVLYFCTISRLVMKVSDAVIHFIKSVINKVVNILLLPFRVLWKRIKPRLSKSKKSLNFYLRLKMRRAKRNWRIIRKKI